LSLLIVDRIVYNPAPLNDFSGAPEQLVPVRAGSLHDLKPRFVAALGGITTNLARRGTTATSVTVAALPVAVLAAVALVVVDMGFLSPSTDSPPRECDDLVSALSPD